MARMRGPDYGSMLRAIYEPKLQRQTAKENYKLKQASLNEQIRSNIAREAETALARESLEARQGLYTDRAGDIDRRLGGTREHQLLMQGKDIGSRERMPSLRATAEGGLIDKRHFNAMLQQQDQQSFNKKMTEYTKSGDWGLAREGFDLQRDLTGMKIASTEGMQDKDIFSREGMQDKDITSRERMPGIQGGVEQELIKARHLNQLIRDKEAQDLTKWSKRGDWDVSEKGFDLQGEIARMNIGSREKIAAGGEIGATLRTGMTIKGAEKRARIGYEEVPIPDYMIPVYKKAGYNVKKGDMMPQNMLAAQGAAGLSGMLNIAAYESMGEKQAQKLSVDMAKKGPGVPLADPEGKAADQLDDYFIDEESVIEQYGGYLNKLDSGTFRADPKHPMVWEKAMNSFSKHGDKVYGNNLISEIETMYKGIGAEGMGSWSWTDSADRRGLQKRLEGKLKQLYEAKGLSTNDAKKQLAIIQMNNWGPEFQKWQDMDIDEFK